MSKTEGLLSSWQERLTALKNIPPVLGIVWRSGPLVVSCGLVLRLITSLLPIALLWVAKLIIDSIVHTVATHSPVQPRLWWVVAAGFGLAVFLGILVGF